MIGCRQSLRVTSWLVDAANDPTIIVLTQRQPHRPTPWAVSQAETSTGGCWCHWALATSRISSLGFAVIVGLAALRREVQNHCARDGDRRVLDVEVGTIQRE